MNLINFTTRTGFKSRPLFHKSSSINFKFLNLSKQITNQSTRSNDFEKDNQPNDQQTDYYRKNYLKNNQKRSRNYDQRKENLNGRTNRSFDNAKTRPFNRSYRLSNNKFQNKPDNKATKKEYSFGKLNPDQKMWLESEFLENDPDNMERMEVITNKRPRNYYLFEIKDAIYKDKKLGVHKALELYREMQLDRKKINSDFYGMLIKGCGLVGYVDKAFELYGEYLNLKPPYINRSIVTSMFNSCANSPDKQLGIDNAKKLYDELKLSGYSFNLLNYNCLIRTFGLLGDLDTSFAFFDTIIEEKFHPNVDTFNNLLSAVCTNQNQGLSIATNLIQAMRFLNIKPNIYTYNMLYRIIRDCNFGSEEELNDQIRHFKFSEAITSEFLRNVLFRQRQILKKNYNRQIEQQNQQEVKQIEQRSTKDSSSELVVHDDKLDELMCLNFLGSNVDSISNQHKIVQIDYASLSKPENRLKLIGGQDYLFKYMLRDGVRSNIRTISLLTALIPNNEKEETQLIKHADDLRIKLDTDFFNMIIRKANIRCELEVAKKYLRMMSARGLAPNIQTYGVMAIGSYTGEEIRDFLSDMNDFGIRPNIVIMTTLIDNAIDRYNYFLIARLIRYLDKYGIKPNSKLAERLVIADELAQCQFKLIDTNSERGKEMMDKLNTSYLIFKKEMSDYLKEYPIIEKEDFLKQFETEEVPRNLELHKFKVRMCKLLAEKRRYMNELNDSSIDLNEPNMIEKDVN